MLRGDPAGTSVADQTSVASRRDTSPGRSARPSAHETLLSRRKFGPQWAGALAASVLVAAGAFHGVKNLKVWVIRKSPLTLTADDVSLQPEAPKWLIDGRERVVAQIPELGRTDDPANLLELDANEIAKRLRMGMPWLESVESVHLRYPGTLEIRATFRRPLMALKLKDQGVVLLDRHGVILPEADVRKDMSESLIEFNFPDTLVQDVAARGGKSPFDIPVGQIWEDVRVGEALRLAKFLTDKQQIRSSSKKLIRHITAVDVKDRLIVRTVDGLWIMWGRPPGDESPGEPDAETKWRHLMTWLESANMPTGVNLNKAILVFEKDRAVLSMGG
jgi:hypothetical protein